ncbi:MAG TPA: hypothetical protein VK932_19120 [Kofleriaceae bacterium]|nr:hypothetical protein [Kofleriaceae bacterium]
MLDFVDDRLDHMLEAPDMWGSGESVELQILQLLEMRVLLLEPDQEEGWRSVQTDYEHFLAKQFPGAPPTILSVLLEDRSGELTTLLGQFVAAQRDVHRPGPDQNGDSGSGYGDLTPELMLEQSRYSWDQHPEAVLGTIYLYFAYGTEVPPGVLADFVTRHQDAGLLNEDKVRAAIAAVARLDGGPGLGSSQLLRDFWNALVPLRPRLPPRAGRRKAPERRGDGRR